MPIGCLVWCLIAFKSRPPPLIAPTPKKPHTPILMRISIRRARGYKNKTHQNPRGNPCFGTRDLPKRNENKYVLKETSKNIGKINVV